MKEIRAENATIQGAFKKNNRTEFWFKDMDISIKVSADSDFFNRGYRYNIHLTRTPFTKLAKALAKQDLRGWSI